MKKWFAIIVLALAQFVMILDSTVMNVSISNVAQDLGTSISGMQAAITLYALTMAAFMLTGGKLGDIWGRRKAFKIGSVIYGIGSLTTAIAPSLTVLLVGWSLIEGLGAVLVIPAIAALTAANYTGKDRVVAFSILGAVTGLAAALGPIIGGFVTTNFTWRYVFAAETLVMIFVLFVTPRIKDAKISTKATLHVPSVVLSAAGMSLLVFGVLQSKTWGWINPMSIPEIAGRQIAPFGISLVAYLILAGIAVLYWFYSLQQQLEQQKKSPLLNVSMLRIPTLKSGLTVFFSQYFTIAAIFFVIPVYLQTILGYDALETGIKLLPLSFGLIIFSVIGSKLTATVSVRSIVRWGQAAMALGSLLMLGSIEVELRSRLFWVGMFCVGVGFGLLASQLGNSNMSAVDKSASAEVGGLQGTFQNLGTSFGTALVGSVFMLTLASGFTSAVQTSPDLSPQQVSAISSKTEEGVEIVSRQQAEDYVIASGGSSTTADTVATLYQSSQLQSLRTGMFFVFVATVCSLALSRKLPNTS